MRWLRDRSFAIVSRLLYVGKEGARTRDVRCDEGTLFLLSPTNPNTQLQGVRSMSTFLAKSTPTSSQSCTHTPAQLLPLSPTMSAFALSATFNVAQTAAFSKARSVKVPFA
jgi:hypothetical protein